MRSYQESVQSPWIAKRSARSPVSVHTEWQPLEEVIIGTIMDARVPDWHDSVSAVVPPNVHHFFRENSGRPFPIEQVLRAQAELDALAIFLEKEGVTVRRGLALGLHKPLATPCFTASGGFYNAMPRDCLLAIGNKIIEAPMSWRNRYFETFAFRSIVQEYFVQGCEWICAPKPMLADELYNPSYGPKDSVVGDIEPVFDAADFVRVGRDIVGQVSHVTNWLGIEWLQRILEPEYRIHVFEFDEPSPMHIDTTIVPLKPGKLLVNPEWVTNIPRLFRDWELLIPPKSSLPESHDLYLSSRWISLNTLMLDERRVLVEASEEPLMEAFVGWGFEPIPIPFKNFQTFGGSFHCATLDVRRAGNLESYF